MHLSYQFTYNGQVYFGRNVDIGEIIDIEHERKDVRGLRIAAICNAFDLTVGYDDEQIEKILNGSAFEWCDLD